MEDNYKTSPVTEKDALRAELETVGPTDAGIAAEDYENFKTMAQPFTEKILKNIQVRKSFCFGFAIIAKVIGDKNIYIYIKIDNNIHFQTTFVQTTFYYRFPNSN